MRSSAHLAGTVRRWTGWAAPLIASQLGLLALRDLAAHLELALAVLGLGFVGLAWSSRRLAAAGLDRAEVGRGILLVAALLRLLALPLPATLSDDVERYLWDGRVVTAGFDPYRLAPASEELTALRDTRWQRLPHRDVPTVYPPLALGLFALAGLTPWPFLGLKLALAMADLVGCAWLLRLAETAKLPAERTLWFAWNPLVVLEVAGMGHVDGLAVACAVGAVLAVARGRAALAALATAAGALAKLVPLAAMAGWARASRRPARFLVAAGGTLGLVLVPLLARLGGPPPGLVTYGVAWEFDGPFYEPLWRLLAAVGADSGLKMGLDQLKEWTGHHVDLALNQLYPWVYPQWLAKLVLGVGILGVLARHWRAAGHGDSATATRRLFGGLLLCSATVYPWYLLWVLPWAALTLSGPWLLLAATSLLSYLPQHRTVDLFPATFLLVWLPPAALALGTRWRRLREPA